MKKSAEGAIEELQRSPEAWADLLDKVEPARPGQTQWFPFTVKPVRVGLYERHMFEYFEHQYWDGQHWLSKEGGKPVQHPSKVFWPCWRGQQAPSH